MDFLSIPEYVIKKGRPLGHRYGKKPGDKEYYLANRLKEKCTKKKFQGIHDRFAQDHAFGERILKTIEMKKFVDDGMFLQMKITLICQKKNASTARTNGGLHLNKSGSDTLPLRKRSDFQQALSTLERSHQEAGEEQLAPTPYWKNNGSRHRVRPLHGGNGKTPGGLPKNSKKVKKDEASTVLGKNGETCCLQNLGENLRR